MTLSSVSFPHLRAGTRWNVRVGLRFAILWLCFCAALGAGVSVRRWVWDHSASMRFKGDIDNGFYWGDRVNQDEQINFTRAPTWGEFFAGYRGLYEKEEAKPTTSHWMRLDYSPLRLLVMSVWVHGILVADPEAASFIDRDVSPLLWFNTICALVSAIGVYMLVRLWLQRRAAISLDRPPRAIDLRAWLAGLCVWFNPAILIDAHAWPQWDVWCLPFYIWAIFAASVGGWFWAGALIAIGGMLKGQILIVAPVLIVWAIFSGGIRQTALALLGVLSIAALSGSIWLLPTAAAWAWIIVVITLLITVGLLLSRRLRGFWMYYLAALLCAGLMIGAWIFHGSLAWLRIGFTGAADNFHVLRLDAINFSSILTERYGWQIDDTVFTWHGHPISINWLLRIIYFVALILCGVAAAVQTRRRSPRVLIALTAPWIIMYAILPQMHERYLVWGAAMASIGVAISLELGILFLFTVAIACASMLIAIYHGPGYTQIDRLDPDLGWVVLLLAAAYFFQIWKRDPSYA